MYLPKPQHKQDATQCQFFYGEFNRLEFRVFLLQDWMPY